MKLKQKIRNLVSPLYNKVWHAPKGKLKERLKQACDDLPKNQRLMVVSILLSVFVLTAFFVFGHACYKMGARQAYDRDSKYIELLTGHDSSIFIQSKQAAYDEMEKENVLSDSIFYEAAR